MKDIEILTFEKISERKFKVKGRIENKEFYSESTIWKGEVIFKVLEDGIVKKKTESAFTVGEKMSIARLLKKYSLGKVDKTGRPANDPKNTGVGLVIQLQNTIDELNSKVLKLQNLLEDHNIQYHDLQDEDHDQKHDSEQLFTKDEI